VDGEGAVVSAFDRARHGVDERGRLRVEHALTVLRHNYRVACAVRPVNEQGRLRAWGALSRFVDARSAQIAEIQARQETTL
jgi:hypothetical protein